MIISTIFANLSWIGWLAAALFYVAIALLSHWWFVFWVRVHQPDTVISAPRMALASFLWPITWLGLSLSYVVILATTVVEVHATRTAKRRSEAKKRNVRVGGEL